MGKGSEDFQQWYIEHKPECEKTWDGSSSSMETGIATMLWGRSVEKWKLRYTTILGDGDASVYSELC